MVSPPALTRDMGFPNCERTKSFHTCCRIFPSREVGSSWRNGAEKREVVGGGGREEGKGKEGGGNSSLPSTPIVPDIREEGGSCPRRGLVTGEADGEKDV